MTEPYEPNGEGEWYFFTSRRKKYPNGERPDRSTENGFWKPTGMDKSIPGGGLKPIGSKKTLEFHSGRHPSGNKTEWKMHEYKVDPSLIKPQNKPQDGMTVNSLKFNFNIFFKYLYNIWLLISNLICLSFVLSNNNYFRVNYTESHSIIKNFFFWSFNYEN